MPTGRRIEQQVGTRMENGGAAATRSRSGYQSMDTLVLT